MHSGASVLTPDSCSINSVEEPICDGAASIFTSVFTTAGFGATGAAAIGAATSIAVYSPVSKAFARSAAV